MYFFCNTCRRTFPENEAEDTELEENGDTYPTCPYCYSFDLLWIEKRGDENNE